VGSRLPVEQRLLELINTLIVTDFGRVLGVLLRQRGSPCPLCSWENLMKPVNFLMTWQGYGDLRKIKFFKAHWSATFACDLGYWKFWVEIIPQVRTYLVIPDDVMLDAFSK
jgi:hypothetical protein